MPLRPRIRSQACYWGQRLYAIEMPKTQYFPISNSWIAEAFAFACPKWWILIDINDWRTWSFNQMMFQNYNLFHFQCVNWRMPLRLRVRNHICQKRNTFSFPICESIEALALTRPKSWILIEINYLITWCSKTLILFHLKFVNWRTPLRLRVWSHESLLRSTILRNRHAKTVILFHFQFVNWRKPLHLRVQNDASWLRSTIFRIKISFFLFLYFWIGIDAWRWGFTGHAILL